MLDILSFIFAEIIFKRYKKAPLATVLSLIASPFLLATFFLIVIDILDAVLNQNFSNFFAVILAALFFFVISVPFKFAAYKIAKRTWKKKGIQPEDDIQYDDDILNEILTEQANAQKPTETTDVQKQPKSKAKNIVTTIIDILLYVWFPLLIAPVYAVATGIISIPVFIFGIILWGVMLGLIMFANNVYVDENHWEKVKGYFEDMSVFSEKLIMTLFVVSIAGIIIFTGAAILSLIYGTFSIVYPIFIFIFLGILIFIIIKILKEFFD